MNTTIYLSDCTGMDRSTLFRNVLSNTEFGWTTPERTRRLNFATGEQTDVSDVMLDGVLNAELPEDEILFIYMQRPSQTMVSIHADGNVQVFTISVPVNDFARIAAETLRLNLIQLCTMANAICPSAVFFGSELETEAGSNDISAIADRAFSTFHNAYGGAMRKHEYELVKHNLSDRYIIYDAGAVGLVSYALNDYLGLRNLLP